MAICSCLVLVLLSVLLSAGFPATAGKVNSSAKDLLGRITSAVFLPVVSTPGQALNTSHRYVCVTESYSPFRIAFRPPNRNVLFVSSLVKSPTRGMLIHCLLSVLDKYVWHIYVENFLLICQSNTTKEESGQYHGEKKLPSLLPVPKRKPEKPLTLLSCLLRRTPKPADRALCSFSFSSLTTARRACVVPLFLRALRRQ